MCIACRGPTEEKPRDEARPATSLEKPSGDRAATSPDSDRGAAAQAQEADTALHVHADPAKVEIVERGKPAVVFVWLDQAPARAFELALVTSRVSEATVAPDVLRFDASNWKERRRVEIRPTDDWVVDGPQAFTIDARTRDSKPMGTQTLVHVTNGDDDQAAILVDPSARLVTNESGLQARFTIRLASEPRADVTLALWTSTPAEATVSPTTFTFGRGNWNIPQVATLTGVDDEVADGPQTVRVVTGPATSEDPAYAGKMVPDVLGENADNDTAAIIVVPTNGLVTSEAGGQATFSIRLTTRPSADVTIALRSTEPSEGTVSPASVSFSRNDWSERSVTVTGVDDFFIDGNRVFTITVGPVDSVDRYYRKIDPPDVTITNTDNDVRVYPGWYRGYAPYRGYP